MLIYSIEQTVFAPKFKVRAVKKELRLSVAVTFEGSSGTIYVFELLLRGKKKFTPGSLEKYLDNATIQCFRYQGFQV